MAAYNSYVLTGGNGSLRIDDTSDHAVSSPNRFFMAVQVIGTADAVLDYSAMNSAGYTWKIDDFDSDMTIPKGTTIYPWATGLTLVSGEVIAYYA